jgi:aminoglycoside phosphotransferase family enzyme
MSEGGRSATPAEAVDTDRKVAFLADPANHPGRPAAVEVVETHMSWVFLTDRHVYKFKKPVELAHMRFATLAARHANCREEVRLNARLAPDVYIGVVPLVQRARDGLAIDGDGTPVEWLVKMHRLPRAAMLDDALARGAVGRDGIRRAIRVLAAFYRRALPALADPANYIERLRMSIEAHAAALDGVGFPRVAAGTDVPGALLDYLERGEEPLAARATGGHVIEGHGDLRPDHVCLTPHPVFIDCLEFSRELRIIDVADELAYLALECECLDAPFVGATAFDVYAEATGDLPPRRVIAFYKARRGLLRARLCLSHLADGRDEDAQARWSARASMYMEAAARYCRTL